ncbi:hypothetical protein ACN38_g11755, partial [Penicillium nordicum]
MRRPWRQAQFRGSTPSTRPGLGRHAVKPHTVPPPPPPP